MNDINRKATLIVINKHTGNSFTFDDATTILEENRDFQINFVNHTRLLLKKKDWFYKVVQNEHTNLESENLMLRNTIVNMCKKAWGGE